MKIGVAAAGVLVCAGGALAQWSDDFNRPDGPIGGDWTVVSGTWAIVSNQGTHQSTLANEILQHNLASMAYGDSVSSLDVFSGTASQFSAVLVGLGGTDGLMVKIQDQVTGTPGFSHIGIYHRTSATAWGNWVGGTTTLPGGGTSTSGFVALPVGMEFASARVHVSFPTADMVQLDIDAGINGTIDMTFTRDGISAFSANFGTGFGISAWGNTAVFDNWNLVPSPGALALLGLGGLLAARRRRA